VPVQLTIQDKIPGIKKTVQLLFAVPLGIDLQALIADSTDSLYLPKPILPIACHIYSIPTDMLVEFSHISASMSLLFAQRDPLCANRPAASWLTKMLRGWQEWGQNVPSVDHFRVHNVPIQLFCHLRARLLLSLLRMSSLNCHYGTGLASPKCQVYRSYQTYDALSMLGAQQTCVSIVE